MKLNLGCGSKILEGYINVDKFQYYPVDVVHDLENFPWPWSDSEVEDIILSHVLEHIGQDPDIFNSIIKELYRVCKNGAVIDIAVPHPRHDDFLADPTHVRPITILGLSLYDKELNEKWAAERAANTPLALIHGVNFKIVESIYSIEPDILEKYNTGIIDRDELDSLIKHQVNIVKQISIKWKVIK
mgnify:CR=1 FL=1